MEYKKYCLVSGALFFLVAAAHLLRIVLAAPVQIGEYAVPMGPSWIGLIVPAALAIWAFRIGLGKKTN